MSEMRASTMAFMDRTPRRRDWFRARIGGRHARDHKPKGRSAFRAGTGRCVAAATVTREDRPPADKHGGEPVEN
jgi:hypothetical protein